MPHAAEVQRLGHFFYLWTELRLRQKPKGPVARMRRRGIVALVVKLLRVKAVGSSGAVCCHQIRSPRVFRQT